MNNVGICDEKKGSEPDRHHPDSIIGEMRKMGLPEEFLRSLMRTVSDFEGIEDLMNLWMNEDDPQDRDEVIADLRESLEDIEEAPNSPRVRPYLPFDNLEEIRKDIEEFKKALRTEVEKRGGISELARRTGIPQPSLSRFFASASMPRRTTLYKIAEALNLPETSIASKWTR